MKLDVRLLLQRSGNELPSAIRSSNSQQSTSRVAYLEGKINYLQLSIMALDRLRPLLTMRSGDLQAEGASLPTTHRSLDFETFRASAGNNKVTVSNDTESRPLREGGRSLETDFGGEIAPDSHDRAAPVINYFFAGGEELCR